MPSAGQSSLSPGELREITQRREAGESWESIDASIGRTTRHAYSRARGSGALARALEGRDAVQIPPKRPESANGAIMAGSTRPVIQGITAGESLDPEAVWAKAEALWRKQQAEAARRETQKIRFGYGPACIIFASDLHLGGHGVDYPRVRNEASIMRDIPNSGVWLAGDVIDNFIWQWCASIRHQTEITIPEELVLAKTVLDMIGPNLIASVGGNHDAWSIKAAGIDILRDLTTRVRPDVLYDTDDCAANVEVGTSVTRVRVRHKWRGTSIWNATHGQERAGRFDNDADVYVGAHTHTEGSARSFSVGGVKKLAIQLGAYKRDDAYARTNGFAKPDSSTAVALIIDEKGRRVAVEYLELAAEMMYRMSR